MRHRLLTFGRGHSRFVVCCGKMAIKLPRLRFGWTGFLRGLLGNLQERSLRSQDDRSLCPILFSDPLGLIVVMRRAYQPVPHRVVEEAITNRSVSELAAAYGEAKADSWGVLDGRLVLVDYGS